MYIVNALHGYTVHVYVMDYGLVTSEFLVPTRIDSVPRDIALTGGESTVSEEGETTFPCSSWYDFNTDRNESSQSLT